VEQQGGQEGSQPRPTGVVDDAVINGLTGQWQQQCRVRQRGAALKPAGGVFPHREHRVGVVAVKVVEQKPVFAGVVDVGDTGSVGCCDPVGVSGGALEVAGQSDIGVIGAHRVERVEVVRADQHHDVVTGRPDP
jgi:hypothetical protein